MPMWRCPHCGTPQAETARCWVCHRSSTACATCRHFRRSIAAQLGYCGLDRQRRPLRGDEIRACWEAAASMVEADPEVPRRPFTAPLDIVDDRTPVRRLEFVEVAPASRTVPPRPSARGNRAGRPAGSAPELVGAASTVSGIPGMPSPTDAMSGDGGEPASAAEPRWSLWGDADA